MKTIYLLTILGVALGALACNPPYYRKASLPNSLSLKAQTRYMEISLLIHDGGKSPRGVEKLTASCSDTSVCRVIPKDARTPRPFLQVIGLRAGTTILHIQYFHPVRKKIIKETIGITVTAQKHHPVLEVGKPLPMGATAIFPIENEVGTKVNAQCSRDNTMPLLTSLVQPGDSHFKCHIPEKLDQGIYAVRECTGFCPIKGEERQRFLCVQKSGSTVSAITVFQHDKKTGKYEKSFTVGSPVGVTCRLTQN
ncbi:hypothetical protein KKF84_12405 [Myxococcota bacterium]|nr:hypothetical protein [Myxococcota bacterium]MBU1536117.1 hypothetical protein [Myxococcota bacterium]